MTKSSRTVTALLKINAKSCQKAMYGTQKNMISCDFCIGHYSRFNPAGFTETISLDKAPSLPKSTTVLVTLVEEIMPQKP